MAGCAALIFEWKRGMKFASICLQRGLAVPDVLIPLIIVAVGAGFFWHNEKSHAIDHPVAVVGKVKSVSCVNTGFYQWIGGGPTAEIKYEFLIPLPFELSAVSGTTAAPATRCVGGTCDGEPASPAQMSTLIERIAYRSMQDCSNGPHSVASSPPRTIWAGDNDFNGTIQARFTVERVPETQSLWITGAVLAVYFPLYFWGLRLQRADQRAKALGLPVDTGPRKSPGIDRGWRWFSHAIRFAKIFVFVSIGMLVVTTLVGVDSSSGDEHMLRKYQWHIIVAICVGWMFFGSKRQDKRALRFTELAESLHREVTVVDEFERWFTINVDGRDFVVTENYDGNRRTDAAGWCLYSSTPLLHDRWNDRNVKICKWKPVQTFGFVLPRLVSGEAVFDEHFVITELAASVEDKTKTLRDQMDERKNQSHAPWLNEPARNAITAFYGLSPRKLGISRKS